VLGVADVYYAEAFNVVDGGQAGQNLNVAAVAGPAVEVDYPRGFEPSLVDPVFEHAHVLSPVKKD